jgi:small subunit ribosomal protein S20
MQSIKNQTEVIQLVIQRRVMSLHGRFGCKCYAIWELTVANIKSAIKRIQITERNRLQNKSYKSAIRTLTKRFLTAVEAYEANPSDETLTEAKQRMATVYSKIDKAVKRGVLHRNTGARKKSRIARIFKQASTNQVAS